jgi:hypothetical protein
MHDGTDIRWRLGERRDDAEPEQHSGKQTGHLSRSHNNSIAAMGADLFKKAARQDSVSTFVVASYFFQAL